MGTLGSAPPVVPLPCDDIPGNSGALAVLQTYLCYIFGLHFNGLEKLEIIQVLGAPCGLARRKL